MRVTFAFKMQFVGFHFKRTTTQNLQQLTSDSMYSFVSDISSKNSIFFTFSMHQKLQRYSVGLSVATVISGVASITFRAILRVTPSSPILALDDAIQDDWTLFVSKANTKTKARCWLIKDTHLTWCRTPVPCLVIYIMSLNLGKPCFFSRRNSKFNQSGDRCSG